MSSLHYDAEYHDLIWMEFDGRTWEEFSLLVSELKVFVADITAPYSLVFYPDKDMPRGNPIPHISNMSRFLEADPRFNFMIAIVPSWMRITSIFANMASKLFRDRFSQNAPVVVTSREQALAVYLSHHRNTSA
ncbi:MAG: hypothetical protein ACOCYT_01550 [Chloroflexota bacterium]